MGEQDQDKTPTSNAPPNSPGLKEGEGRQPIKLIEQSNKLQEESNKWTKESSRIMSHLIDVLSSNQYRGNNQTINPPPSSLPTNLPETTESTNKLLNIIKQGGSILESFFGALRGGQGVLTAVLQQFQELATAARKGALTGLGWGFGQSGAEQGAGIGRSAILYKQQYGMEAGDIQNIMSSAIGANIASGANDLRGSAGSTYEGGLISQLAITSKAIGESYDSIIQLDQQLATMNVGLGSANEELIDMTGIARSVNRAQKDYRQDTMNVQNQLRKYGMDIEVAEGLTAMFAGALEKGTISAENLQSVFSGFASSNDMMGARAFIAELAVGAGGVGGITATGFAGQAQVRNVMEGGQGSAEDQKALLGLLNEQAKAFATGATGKTNTEDPEFLAQYSMYMQQFGISTGETLETAEQMQKAIDIITDPATKMKESAANLLEYAANMDTSMKGHMDNMEDINFTGWADMNATVSKVNEEFKTPMEQIADLLELLMYSLQIWILDIIHAIAGDSEAWGESKQRNQMVAAVYDLTAAKITAHGGELDAMDKIRLIVANQVTNGGPGFQSDIAGGSIIHSQDAINALGEAAEDTAGILDKAFKQVGGADIGERFTKTIESNYAYSPLTYAFRSQLSDMAYENMLSNNESFRTALNIFEDRVEKANEDGRINPGELANIAEQYNSLKNMAEYMPEGSQDKAMMNDLLEKLFSNLREYGHIVTNADKMIISVQNGTPEGIEVDQTGVG
jgi:hypothetical protein